MNWNVYFMKHAELVTIQSKCISRKVGAILVKDRRIISTGYNGTPKGFKNCNKKGCKRCLLNKNSGENLEKCLCVHAEINTILFSARNGMNISNSYLYSTTSPCLECSKSLINAGIKKIYYKEFYKTTPIQLLKKCKVRLIKI